MDIIYYKDKEGNFGDDLNEWLWCEVCPAILKKESDYSLLGVGSIINKDIIKDRKVIVFGSGVAYGEIPNISDLTIKCVRGKLTAKILGIDESFAISDGAILIREIPYFSPISENKRSGVILIPHHLTFHRYDLSEICNKAGIELINPSEDSKYIINKIRHAKLVITEAMHGAIIADTVRVRWIPIVLSSNISTFKWLDWLSMFNLEYKPIYIGVPNLFDYKINNLLIKYGMDFFKKNHSNMNVYDLLKWNDKTFSFKLYEKFFKCMKPFLNLKNRNRKMTKLLVSLKDRESYLSNDDIFNENLRLLKIKLQELL